MALLYSVIWLNFTVRFTILDVSEIGYDLLTQNDPKTLVSFAGAEIIGRALESKHPGFKALPKEQKEQAIEAVKYVISKGIQGVYTMKQDGLY